MRLVTVVVSLAGLALLQLPIAPPMKLGLWETTSSMSMTMNGAAHSMPGMKSRTCVTAETWAKAFAGDRPGGECTRTGEKLTGSHYTFDLTCPKMNGTIHGDMEFAELGSAGHGKVHMEMSPGGHAVVSDMEFDSHFVSADCGSVAPGKAQLVH